MAPGGTARKVPSREALGEPRGRSRPPREAEIDQLFAPRCRQEPPNDFCLASGGPRGQPGTRPGRLGSQSSGYEGLWGPPGLDFGASGGPLWSLRASIFKPPGVDFWRCTSRRQKHRTRQRRSNSNATNATSRKHFNAPSSLPLPGSAVCAKRLNNALLGASSRAQGPRVLPLR